MSYAATASWWLEGKAQYTAAGFADHARAFRTQHKIALHGPWVGSGAEIDIDEIDADGGMPDQHLAVLGPGRVDVAPFEDFRAAGPGGYDRIGHEVSPEVGFAEA